MTKDSKNSRDSGGMLCDVSPNDLNFLKDGEINLIILSQYQIGIRLDNGSEITIHNQLNYKNNKESEEVVCKADSEKLYVPYGGIIGERFVVISVTDGSSLEFGLSDGSFVRLPLSKDGFEAFLVHGPNGQVYVFV